VRICREHEGGGGSASATSSPERMSSSVRLARRAASTASKSSRAFAASPEGKRTRWAIYIRRRKSDADRHRAAVLVRVGRAGERRPVRPLVEQPSTTARFGDRIAARADTGSAGRARRVCSSRECGCVKAVHRDVAPMPHNGRGKLEFPRSKPVGVGIAIGPVARPIDRAESRFGV